MAQVVFLGIGGAMARGPADNHTALVVRAGASTILMDSGPSIMRQLELAGIGIEELTHVYLSHQHGDHSLGLPMLLLNRVLLWPDLPLTVMAAPDVLKPASDLVTLAYPDLAQRMEAGVRFAPLAGGISPLPCPSDASLTYRLAPAQHSVPTWAIRLGVGAGKSLVMSGDTRPAESVERLASGATLLVHDAYFLTPPGGDLPLHSAAVQVGELASRAGVGAVALVHRKDPSPQASPAYRALAAKYFGGEIHVPQAGDALVV